MSDKILWPRMRDLPEEEREPFGNWLNEFGQTRPLMEDVPMEEQDAYYKWDYERWKQLLEIRAMFGAQNDIRHL